MTTPIDNVYVNVERFDDEETSCYVASCDQLMFTTDGETFEELLSNIEECLALNLRQTDSIVEFNVSPDAHMKFLLRTY